MQEERKPCLMSNDEIAYSHSPKKGRRDSLMKSLSKTISLLVVVSFCAHVAMAQEQDGPKPDRWRGLVLNESTTEDAIRILGQPAKDSMNRISAEPINNWLTKKRKDKIFRTLEFKKPEGVDKALLYFLDGKLIAIMLNVKKGISPEGLSNIYGIQFQPVVSAFDLAMRPRDFERNQGKIYPKTYPTIYHMVAVSEQSFITATIGNVPGFGRVLAQGAGIPDKPGSFPGRVDFITLISRTLENRDGADVLK